MCVGGQSFTALTRVLPLPHATGRWADPPRGQGISPLKKRMGKAEECRVRPEVRGGGRRAEDGAPPCRQRPLGTRHPALFHRLPGREPARAFLRRADDPGGGAIGPRGNAGGKGGRARVFGAADRQTGAHGRRGAGTRGRGVLYDDTLLAQRGGCAPGRKKNANRDDFPVSFPDAPGIRGGAVVRASALQDKPTPPAAFSSRITPGCAGL